jgi:hypothetical protein
MYAQGLKSVMRQHTTATTTTDNNSTNSTNTSDSISWA